VSDGGGRARTAPDGGQRAGGWRRWSPWARRAAVVAAGSRLFVAAVGVIAGATMRAHDVNPIMRFPERAELYRGWLGLLLNPWSHFDGVWLIHIANEGYQLKNNTPAFFPLYPIVIRAGGTLLLGNYQLAGIALSTLFFLAAMWALFVLVEGQFSPRVAFYSVLFISLSPVSFFFQAVYSESLYLLLSVACFLLVKRRRWAPAGLVGMLATATRLSGVFLLIPMTVAYLRDRKAGGPKRDRPLLWFLLVPAGVAVYAAYLAVLTGDSGTFGSAERSWGRDPALPFVTVWRAGVAAYHGATYLLFGFGIPADPAYVGETLAFIRRETAVVNVYSFFALVFATVVLILAWKRLPLSYSLYAVAVLSLPLLAPRPQVPLMSMPRFVLMAFPVMVALAVLTEQRRVLRRVMIVVFAAGLIYLTGRFALWLFVA
jgi:hypothetical protein